MAKKNEQLKPTVIHWFRDVTTDSVDALIDEILARNEENGGAGVKLYMSSAGGNLSAATHFLQIIRHLVPKLQTIATYDVSSAGTMIFLAGRERFAFPRARFLFHEVRDTGKFRSANEEYIRGVADDLAESQRIMVETVAEILGRKPEEIAAICKEDKSFGTDKALELGLIKEVLDPSKTP